MDEEQSYHREDRWSKSYCSGSTPSTSQNADKFRAIQREYKGQDDINWPLHYNQGIETTDYIISNDMNFCEGNIIKYVTRYKLKGGLEDLEKAKWYLEKLIQITE